MAKKKIFGTAILILMLVFCFNPAFSKEKIEINFFYGKTCPHCAAEQKFLDKIEKKYPEIKINRYPTDDPQSQKLLRELCEKCKAENYIGLVPLTFVEENFFLGFDNADGQGKKIENSIKEQIREKTPAAEKNKNTIDIPFIGEVETSRYSLPALAIVLGFFDGFNFCSLGSLILILGLTLSLKSKTKILILGAIFILTTAVVYGVLIFFWHRLFSILSLFLRKMEIATGILSLFGGWYFLKEFLKFKKEGLICELKSASQKFNSKIQKIFEKKTDILALGGAVLLFASVITIVEFPCSAVLPVLFAGILSKAKLPFFPSLICLALFLFFYLLDEIIVFLIAAFTTKIWLASYKFITYLYLAAGIMMLSLGVYYIFGSF